MAHTAEVAAAIKQFALPDKLGFGAVNAPVMFSDEWRDGKWGAGELLPYGPKEILTGARALQYGELEFEGLKAYRISHTQPNILRTDAYYRRMKLAAERLSMPSVPE